MIAVHVPPMLQGISAIIIATRIWFSRYGHAQYQATALVSVKTFHGTSNQYHNVKSTC